MYDAGVIVGIGETRLGRLPGVTPVELQAEAVRLAVADAGLGPHDIDGLLCLGPYTNPSMMFAATLGEYLGLHPSYQSTIDSGGIATPMSMAFTAVSAIQAGLCTTAVCAFGDAARSGRRPAGRGMTTTADAVEFEEPFGLVGTVVPYALLADRRMQQYGLQERDLGAIAISARNYAARRDNSAQRTPITIEDYLASPVVASPLRRLDCSTIVDGAGAFVVTSRDRAAHLERVPVRIMSFAMRASHRNVGQFPDFDELGLAEIAQDALGRAGMKLEDVDVAQIHDAFTISTAVYLEELGFCGRGEIGEYARDGNLDLGGRCPVNTHGGLLSQGHVGGMLQLTEAVVQLRGTAGPCQVPDARTAMVAGGGGIFGVNAVMLLGRD
jgi:acetyl-CoA acetyltransferase